VTDTAALNLLWCDQLMDGLAAAGVRRVVISPGSRSTPLVLALNRQPRIQSWRHPDERSAAFFALGLASHDHQPVALIATSGSAPGHWLPAVIEANRSGIPLILLSADRPAELQTCGSNQTVDQIHLFGSQVRGYYDAGSPSVLPEALTHIRRLGVQAVHRACGPEPGPVHINLPLPEPLTPQSFPPPPRSGPPVVVARNRIAPDPPQLRRIVQLINIGNGLIVCGPMPPDEAFASAVTHLAGELACPLLADPLSGLRFGGHNHSQVISNYDGFLRADAFNTGQSPDWVLRFGAAPVSKALLDYLARSGAQTILCAPHGDWPDPLHQTTEMVRSDPSLFCAALSEHALRSGQTTWRQRFTLAEQAVDRFRLPAQEIPTEDRLIEELLVQLPAHAILFSGNSLPIRQLDSWSGQRDMPLRIHANRGASGIDGNVSTLLGLAAACEHPVVGLLGDLTFFHDMNGLLFARGLRAVIILFNNNGGGIFGTLPQAGLETFEQQWLMPTHVDFRHTARLYDLNYQRIEQQRQFRPALAKALANPGVDLIEIMLQRERSLARQLAYVQQLKTIVDQTLLT
jgi:2-succinyl-5-enolpyruvyl-6-hydroxy-3-cyclohexene-1-carboxylate synthase